MLTQYNNNTYGWNRRNKDLVSLISSALTRAPWLVHVAVAPSMTSFLLRRIYTCATVYGGAEALSQPLAKIYFLPTVIPQCDFSDGVHEGMLFNLRLPWSQRFLSCALALCLFIEKLSCSSCANILHNRVMLWSHPEKLGYMCILYCTF